MRNLIRATVFAAFGGALLGATPCLAQGTSLAAARELYVAAEYNNALNMLTALAGANTSKTDLQTIDLYRALCLLALGNTVEANKVIESMLMIDPLYRPDTTDLPPRMRSAFSDARKRMLPGLVQQRYVVARAAYEAEELCGRGAGLPGGADRPVDPDLGSAGTQPPLSDLKVLASGFHDLAAKAVLPVETPTEPPPPLAPRSRPLRRRRSSTARRMGTSCRRKPCGRWFRRFPDGCC